MLGKLGKFFRILGFDAKIASPELTDSQILNECILDNRCLLTKDKEFHARMLKSNYGNGSSGNALYIDQPDLESQITFTLKWLKVGPSYFSIENPDQFVNRCSNCNSIVKLVDKSFIKGSVSESTFDKHNKFWKCTNNSCKNIFWIGSHWINILKTLKTVKSELISSNEKSD